MLMDLEQEEIDVLDYDGFWSLDSICLTLHEALTGGN